MDKIKEDLNHEVYLIVGSRGSGKTHKLKQYKKNDKRDYLECLICCPTAGSFTSSYDDFAGDTPKIMAMDEKEMAEELRDFIDRAKNDSAKFAKRLKYREKLDMMEKSGKYDKEKCDMLKKKFPLLRIPHRILVLDDCQGMRILKSPAFLSFTIRHRHSCCDLYILAQNVKGVSPVIRANATKVSIFPFKGSKAVKQLYEEYAPTKDMDEKDFEECMRECCQYESLNIDYNKKDENGKIKVDIS